MFIALTTLMTVRSSGAPCAFICYVDIPLLTERDVFARTGYRHFAPPEQELCKKGCPGLDSLSASTPVVWAH